MILDPLTEKESPDRNMDQAILKKISSGAFPTLLVLSETILLFIFLEGLCSVLFVAGGMRTAPLAERVYTKYDAQLGWVSIPGISVKNIYGEGMSIKINSQGFRNDNDLPVEVPEGKIRVILSGDSFTFGYDVDDHQTWGHLLAGMDDRIETINMGQGGYGLDQAYLWYMRDGKKFKSQIHIVALNPYVLGRSGGRFYGYPKPVMKIANGELIVTNTPVPRRNYFLPFITENLESLRQLSLFRFTSSFIPKKAPDLQSEQEEVFKVVFKIFDKLKETDRQKGSQLIVIYLPTLGEISGDDNIKLRSFLERSLKKREIPFIDLTDDFNSLPKPVAFEMFSASAHYGIKGNRFVAETLYKKLVPFLPINSL